LRAAGRGFGSGAWCFWPSAARSRRTSTSWADGTLRLPRAVVALIAVLLVLAHAPADDARAREAVAFVLSLAMVCLGFMPAHGS
jgi:hypothetical protein